ncbi:MAG TPA: DUF2892 domain-containing protein [Gammaproteobacteria bacterium]|nr:DUF2892 domain-containing protein [Gammaproteobacteria bacterium]
MREPAEKESMQCNVGQTEKIIRIVIGVALIIAGVMYGNWWGTVRLIPLVTGLIGWCPAYKALGLNTRGAGGT